MTAQLFTTPARATDANGDPYSGAVWRFYATGTLTPQNVYADSALGTSLGAEVTADSGGNFVPIYLDPALDYRGILKNASGSVTIFDIDPIAIGSANADDITFLQSGTGAVARTAQAKLRERVTPEDFGAVFDGTPADTAKLASFFTQGRQTIERTASRVFGGEAAGFNGVFGGYADYTGLSPLTRGLHNWAPRDAQVFIDSTYGGLSVVGSSQSSNAVNWPGHPAFVPSSIGVSGFGINDATGGQAWGGYFDVVRMPGVNGFTVALETALVNFGDNVETSPFTLTDGSAKSGVSMWVQSGGGMDLIAADLAEIGYTPRDVNHAAAIGAFLSSYAQTSITAWAVSTAYVVGDKREDTVSNTVWQCVTAHTSPASGTMADDRTANPARWKAIPAHLKGFIFGAGSLAERGAGTNLFSAIEFTERMQVSWFRKTGAGAVEQAATMYADTIADGSAIVDLVFKAGQVFSTAKWSGDADGTYGAKVQGRGSGGAQAISFAWTGVNIEIYVDNTLVKTV